MANSIKELRDSNMDATARALELEGDMQKSLRGVRVLLTHLRDGNRNLESATRRKEAKR